MSYVALATESYDEVVWFYGTALGFHAVSQWDRPRGRGTRFDLGGGLRLEILDSAREPTRMALAPPRDRIHVVVEVDDIDDARRGLSLDAPEPTATSWGARLFQLRDPDGVAVSFLQWDDGDGTPR